jgi:formylglycine-generating enzyme required for sulfatase activity
LVVDDVKGADHMFSAQLIDTKDSKLDGKGSHIRTGVVSGDLSRVSTALVQQLKESRHKHSAAAPARNYPAVLDIEMVFVEGGMFTMGCIAEQGSNCSAARQVTLTSFQIGRYEITKAQWGAVIGSYTNRWGNDDQQPVDDVSWDSVQTFIKKLNSITGKNYRLPTDAEWEYAARGGKQSKGYLYSGSNTSPEVGAFNNSNCISKPCPVGTKNPNELGIYDMSGNVFEWCQDWGGNYTSTPVTDPTGPTTGTTRIIRGGSWSNNVSTILGRHSIAPTTRIDIGFRVVLSAQ